MKKLFLLLLLLTTFVFSQVEVSTRLTRAIQNSKSNEYVRGLILLKDQVDIEALDARLYKEHVTLEQRAYTVITALQEVAARSQGNLTSYLEQQKASRKVFSYQKFWVANMIQIEAQPEVFQALMGSMELSQMDLDAELQFDRPVVTSFNTEGTESVEPGVKIINADKLWRLGITGQGRIVMNIDTGVEKNHPAINYKWRGTHVPANQAWFDPAGTTTPTDCDGHGTHTMGTMCGFSPTTGDTVGVAINAEWIAAKTICTSPHTSNSVAAFQWAMNPDGDPNTITDMPDAISSSWYDPDVSDECNGIYKTTLNAVEAAGIAAVFSAGNSGPSASTITKPKNINTDETNVFAVAAISGATYLGGSNDPIASFSSRGPSVCGGTGALLIKPEVSAPGVAVRSAYPPTGYTSMDGTSMASPHVAGAIALLRSFAPTLTGKQIKLALYNTAKDLGAVGEDNNYGRGLIDVYAAYMTMGTPDTIPPAPTTDLAVTEPTSNGLKITWTAPADTSPSGVVGYKIRYSLTPITDTTSYNNAMPIPFNTMPKPAGQTEAVRVDSLVPATTYYFALRSRDIWGNWSVLSNVASGATLGAPVALTTPDSVKKVLVPMQVVVDSVMIKNNAGVPSTLGYMVTMANNTFPQGMLEMALAPITRQGTENLANVKSTGNETFFGQSIEGQGGPDSAGYKWIDSDEPNGPVYEWNDISTTGTAVTAWTATGTFDPKDEGYAGPFTFGFPFKFYRQAKTQVYISSNGALIFNVPTVNIFTNVAIPTIAEPNQYIAAFWDDLDGRTQGTVHYKAEGDKFIVQFTNWQKYSATGSLTFQYVLYPSGKIMFYYNNMNAILNSATVGIENATGTTGLQIAYNATYVKNNLAVKISAEPDWLNAQNLAGMLYQGNSAAIRLVFRSEDYPAGNYGMDLNIHTNDPAHQLITIPVRMVLNHPAVPITVTAPNGGENWQAGLTKNITWNANEVVNVNIKYTTDNGSSWLAVAQGVSAAAGTYAWTVPATPSTQCKVRVSAALADSIFDVSNANFTISAGAITWSSVVNVKDNSTINQDLTFGLAPTATNGIDLALGEVSLPPAPPAGTFDARLELPLTPADYSWKDYRNDTLQSVAWVAKFQPGASGYPFTFTWNPATLPAGTFMLKDAVTGTLVNVDMKTVGTYTLTNTGISSLKIEFTKQSTIPMAFASGWNMFSVPLVAADMTAATICSGANSNVFGYGTSGYTSATTLGNGKGYWVRYPSASSYNMNGSPVSGNTVALAAGWNMIGPYNWNATVSGITTIPAGIINSSFFEYNNGYVQATMLQKTKGYWVRTSAAGTMTLPASAAKAGEVVIATAPKEWSRIIISDATGAQQTLYAAQAGQESAASAFILPPAPPAGIFDVRYASDKNAEVFAAQPVSVLINGAQYPVKIQVVGMDVTLSDNSTNGKLVSANLKNGESYTLANSGVSSVVFSTSTKPMSYELLQNYPNPFNPSTTIKFGLPEKSNVTLTVFNQLGEKIAVLVSGDKEAGFHTVEWNAANQVSGVYFYELKTDKFTSIKKLILMK